MSDGKWAKGPWRHRGDSVFSADGALIVHCLGGRIDQDGRDWSNEDAAEVDAAFIAAAPDLYEALYLFSRLECDLTGVVAPDLFHRAEAALRKARGET